MELSDKTNLCTAVIHLGLLACYYCISLQLTTSTYAPSRNVENTQRCRSLAKNSLSAAKCLVYIQLLSVGSSLLQSYIVILECSFLYFIFLIARHCQFFLASYQNLQCWCFGRNCKSPILASAILLFFIVLCNVAFMTLIS